MTPFICQGDTHFVFISLFLLQIKCGIVLLNYLFIKVSMDTNLKSIRLFGIIDELFDENIIRATT